MSETNGKAEILDLALKYRPKLLKDVIGQTDAVRSLQKHLKDNTLPHTILLHGGKGCLRGDSLIFDPTDGSCVTVEDRYHSNKSFNVYAMDKDLGLVITPAMPPQQYTVEDMFRVVLEDERDFHVTGEHKIQDFYGDYMPVHVCASRLRASDGIRLSSTLGIFPSVRGEDGWHLTNRLRGSQVDCPPCFGFCGGQLPQEEETVQGRAQRRFDVRERIHLSLRVDGQESIVGYNRLCPRCVRLSMNHYGLQERLFYGTEHQTSGEIHAPFLGLYHNDPPILALSNLSGRDRQRVYPVQGSKSSESRTSFWNSACTLPLACFPPSRILLSPVGTMIKHIERVGQALYYDFHVPYYHNYWMQGVFHHNTGKTTMARILANKLKSSQASGDFREINAANERGIELAREIERAIKSRPLDGGARVWIIDEAHMLTRECQASLLKPLEEPKPYVYFFFCTTNPQKLSAPVRDRFTPIATRAVPNGELQKLILDIAQREGILAEKVIGNIVEAADGSARRALKILGDLRGAESNTEMLEIIRRGGESEDVMSLVRMLLLWGTHRNAYPPWKAVAGVLKRLFDQNEDPEGLRQLILANARGDLLKTGSEQAAKVIYNFREDNFGCGTSGFTLDCFNVISRKT